MNKLRVLSLFSGMGAFEEGLKNENIDYELVNYCEFDPIPAKAYSLMHDVSEDLNLGDINKVDETKLPDFDLMFSGFPCQPFSIAGERLGFEDEEKGNLFFESMRIAKYKKPKFIVCENVKGLTNHDNGRTFKIIINTLEDLGYNNYYKVCNSINYDVPQNRERIFIVSIRKDIDKGTFRFPHEEMTKKRVVDILDVNGERKTPKKSLQPYFNEKYFNTTYKSSNGTVKLFDGCAEGYFTSSYTQNRIYSIYGISPTLTTKNDASYYEIFGHLNSRERFALQGFKKEYVDLLKENGISTGRIDKMSGNSITVNVIQAILKNLLKDYI